MRDGAELAISLLATKLLIPPAWPKPRIGYRLIERMRAAVGYGRAPVSGPGRLREDNSGKRLVRHVKNETAAAWVSLDSGDSDPVRFWDYFIAALRTIEPNAGDMALSLLHSEQPCQMESVLTALINDLAAIPADFTVVLDDYHLISTDAIHAGLAFLLEHLPPKMHVVIATRTEPPLPLSTLRGRGMMLIGADDLRFTVEEEAATLLRDLQSLELSSEDINAINERTEGWAVGLTMTGARCRSADRRMPTVSSPDSPAASAT